LAPAIDDMLANPDIARRWGNAGRERALAYGWPSVARRHLELYEQLQRAPIPQSTVILESQSVLRSLPVGTATSPRTIPV
jgi:hypothetical protein